MRVALSAGVALGLLAGPSALGAQEAAPSPYAGLETREIKALSAEEIRGLRQGEGMGYALAAELNGWPGPKHVLDLADSLDLTTAQRDRIETIRSGMSERARSLGDALVEAETRLDRLFASGTPAPDQVESRVAEIARIEGSLRTVHLVAHLETRGVLTGEQVARYDALRGYGEAAPTAHEHGTGHVHER